VGIEPTRTRRIAGGAPFAFPNDLLDDKSLYEIVCFITILTFYEKAKI